MTNDFKQIKLSQGLFALVDEEDFKELNKYRWYVSFGSHSGVKPYARRYEKGRSFSMHRQILDCPIGLVVDHLNDNSLDNRKRNIECVTPSENTKRHYKRNPRTKEIK